MRQKPGEAGPRKMTPSNNTVTAERRQIPVFVATTVMLSFISFWRAAAIVLSDLASSAYYVGGDTENVIGKSAPWFILAVMLFSYAVRALYIESSSMFVRGGVYRVVKEAMGGTLAKVSVSALLFDYALTGPISATAAGQYVVGFVEDVAKYIGHPVTLRENFWSAVFAILVTLYFWWKNIQGIHESSEKAMQIMKVTTVMVVILIIWCTVTVLRMHYGTIAVIAPNQGHLPPSPIPAHMTLNKESLGWLWGTFASRVTWIIVLLGFGHSVLAMSGEETLAQINREIESPKLKNLEKTGLIIFIYSLLFTSLVSFFAVMIIPDGVRKEYFANLIGGITMYLSGPETAKIVFHGFVVLVGALILAGAVNTAIVGANGVLNRVAEDGVLMSWFQRPQKRYGTTYRIINLVVGLQIATIVFSRGNVYVLAALYAFGVIWSFAMKSLAVLVLRYTKPENREWKVPGNFRIGGVEIPVGLGLISLVLFLTAVVNLFTKPDATLAGVGFSIVFFAIFAVSEHYTHKARGTHTENVEQFRVAEREQLDERAIAVRPGNILVSVRDPRSLAYLRQTLEHTDTAHQDVVVMTARLYTREHSFSGNRVVEAREVFDEYEQTLFTRVVAVAEKVGKPVSLLVVPGTNIFDTIVGAGQRLQSSMIVSGLSTKLTADEQGKFTGDAWERLPAPRQQMILRIVRPDGTDRDYALGPHTPQLRPEDTALIHDLWLEITSDPEFRYLHHYHVVSVAVKELKKQLHGKRRQELLQSLKDELRKGG
jgi:amino acid transporter